MSHSTCSLTVTKKFEYYTAALRRKTALKTDGKKPLRAENKNLPIKIDLRILEKKISENGKNKGLFK